MVLDLTSAAHAAGATHVADTEKAAHATALAGELPEWVELVPAGTFRGLDGRGPYHNADPEAVIQLTRDQTGGNDLPIDYGHALEAEGVVGAAAPAAGWITDLEVRAGEIWGRVAWTEDGERRVRGREFRYLSPVFWHDKEGRVAWIQRAGLTNKPNLPQLRSINTTQHAQEGKEKAVEELLKAVAAALGLPETSDKAAVLARCSAATAAEASLTKVAQSLQLEGSPGADEIVSSIERKVAVDPAKYVPREQFDKVAHALQAAQRAEGERAVDAAIAEGKITPAQRPWALSYHAQDARGFAEFVSKQPKVIDAGSSTTGEPPAGERGQLDETAKSVCAALGIAHDSYTKNLEG